MNRLIILLLILHFLMGCERTRSTSSEYWKSFVNETDKVFFYVVRTSVGSDSAFSYGNDSIGFYFAIHGTVTLPPIGPYHIDIDQVFPRGEELYNLTDTCSFWYTDSNSWSDSLYRAYISFYHDEEGNFYKGKYAETLVMTDTLLSVFSTTIMQKDYTMLDKFKEYYANE